MSNTSNFETFNEVESSAVEGGVGIYRRNNDLADSFDQNPIKTRKEFLYVNLSVKLWL